MPKKEKVILGLPTTDDIDAIANHKGLNQPERFFLYIMRSYMHKNNLTCWPGQERLAMKMNIKERQVRNIITSLVAKGIISVEKRESHYKSGSNHNNRYRFIYPWDKESRPATHYRSDDQSRPVTERRQTGNPAQADRQLSVKQTGNPLPTNTKGKTKKNTNSSSSRKKIDDDENSAYNISQKNNSKNNTAKKGKPSKFPPAVLEKKILAAIKKKKGQVVAEKANRFASEVVDQVKPVHSQSYKNKILESILREKQADFKPETMPSRKWDKVITLDYRNKKSKL